MNKDQIKAKMLESNDMEGEIKKAEHIMKVRARMNEPDKKALFLVKLAENWGNITATCKACNVSRQTYYNWYNEDAEFNARCLDVSEAKLDILEDVAFRKATEQKDTTMLIFLLKTIGAQRGYQENKKVSVQVTKKQVLNLPGGSIEF